MNFFEELGPLSSHLRADFTILRLSMYLLIPSPDEEELLVTTRRLCILRQMS